MLIEKTAGEYAAIFWEACRSSGMPAGKYKTARAFARRNLEKFIPIAIHNLIEIMSRPETPESFKETIYQALLERTNDEQLSDMGKLAELPEYEQTILYKSDQEKPKPVIVNTLKPDNFNFDNKKVI